MSQDYVGEILFRRGVVEKDTLEDALRTADERGLSVIDVLVRKGEAEEAPLVSALAEEMGMEFVPKIDASMVPEALIEAIPIGFARQHHIIPIRPEGQAEDAEDDGVSPVVVAVADPLDPYVGDDIRALLQREVIVKASTKDAIDDVINRVYERKDEADLGDREEDDNDELQDLLDADDEAPIIRFVNNLFFSAVQDRASDIHVEPHDDAVVVRYRIDGRLVQRRSAPRGALAAIIARIKIEAGLNIAEKRLPQDGRISKKIRGKLIDVRVSIIPTAKGESVVMRLLDKENIALDLIDLGFAKRDLDIWADLVTRPNGILLITGPTGSGKSTTLSASLNRINTPDKKILTAENPVEYEIKGVNQLQVHPKIGLTFASALRAFLRQDPDVIMVGEIRDQETAELAIQASLTGHLVLSTLHTNDAPGAIPRLVRMGVQPFQISSTVLGVMAQRLVRKICTHCREPYRPSERDLIELGLDPRNLEAELETLKELARSTPKKAPAKVPAAESGLEDLSALLEPEFEAEPTQVHSIAGLELQQRFGALGLEVPRVLLVDTASHGLLESLAASAEKGQGPSVQATLNRLGDQLAKQLENATPPASADEVIFYRPVGCEECNQIGYRGRQGIFEMMLITEAIRDEILKGSDSKTMQKVAVRGGMRTLREDGARQVLAGITTVEEVLAATQAREFEQAAE